MNVFPKAFENLNIILSDGLIEIFLLNQNIEAIDGEAMGSSGFNQFYGKPIQNYFSVKPCWSYFLLLDNVEI